MRWVVAVLVAFIVFQISVVVRFSRGFEGPDEVQYYRMGLEYGKQRARQRELGWQLRVEVPPTVRRGQRYGFQAVAVDRQGRALEGDMRLKVGRPATRREDRWVDPHAWTPGPGVWDLSFTFTHGRDTLVHKVRVRAE